MIGMRTASARPVSLAFFAGTAVLCFTACGGSIAPSGVSNSTFAAHSIALAARAPATTFTFTTLDDQADPTFNQLLGINNSNKIAGYFGSGLAGHPNKGYTIVPPYGQGNYANENFPGSAQTQVTAINKSGYTAGFWVGSKGVNRGFVEWKGVFTSYRDPNTGSGTVNQLLGLNDGGIAVGFFVDGTGKNHAYKLNQATGVFTPIVPPGGKNAVATGINDNGVIVGFYTVGTATDGFIDKGGSFTAFSFPGSANTMPLGINIHNQIVGSYADSSGNTHGFLLSHPLTGATFQTVD